MKTLKAWIILSDEKTEKLEIFWTRELATKNQRHFHPKAQVKKVTINIHN